MSFIYRFSALTALVLTMMACGLISQGAPPTQTAIPPSDTFVFTATTAPTNTTAPTDTTAPSDTPASTSTPAPLTATINAFIALQTKMVGTSVAEIGPSAHLLGFLIFYSNPVGTPLESWHDVPIMKEATAGQEFQADIYSYKATATLQQATAFYLKQSTTLKWSCFPPASGYGGTGDQANHQSTFICGSTIILLTSYDNNPSQVLVVINKAP